MAVSQRLYEPGREPRSSSCSPPSRPPCSCRTVEELQREQDHCMHLQRIKKKNEITIKDLQAEMEEAEQLKGGKHRIVKPEAKLRAALS